MRQLRSSQQLKFIFGAAGLLLTGAFAFGAPQPAEQGPPPTALTVRSALNFALEHSPDVRSAKEKLVELDAQWNVVFSRVFPTISGNVGGYYKKDALNMGTPLFGGEPYNYYQMGLQISEPIYEGGTTFSALNVAKKEKVMRLYDVQIAERDVTVALIESFYTVLLNQRKLSTLQRQEEVEKKVLATAQNRYKIGRGQLLDVLQIKTQLALIQPKIAEARNQIDVSVASLANLIGHEQSSKLELRGDLEVPPELARLSYDKRSDLPEIQRIRVQQEQFSDQRQVTLGKHLPTLNAVGNWGRASFTKTDLLNAYSTSWSMALQLNIPLFSGLSSMFERRQLASQEAQLGLNEVKLQDQTSINQIKADREFQLRRRLIEASALAATYSEESLREAEKNYRLQTSDYLQLLQAEQNYQQAQFSYDQAKYDFISAAAHFYAASGLPISDLVKVLGRP